ncbi:uncharacterized protein PG998_000290 [Apiospora kogelbergensis]|uniref:uncharacterized protein n=1 Tax=Apiospora kogelbergensis TaxID=1337665 RepID=UPI00312CF05B
MSEPMKEPATATWGLRISDADFDKLKAGFEPESWDDKWGVSAEEQSQSRNVLIHVTRNPTGKDHYVLDIKPHGEDGDSREGIKVEAITWDQKKGEIHITEEQAKKEVVVITRRLLECDFEALPEYDVSILWDHPNAAISSVNGN